MTKITLYFVGYHKHGGIQGIFDGPFLDYGEALEARNLRADSQFRIVRIVIPITKFEILD